MADLNAIVETLSSLTVLQAAELSKMLEEKWGVSAAAPVAVAAAGPAAAAAPASPGSVSESAASRAFNSGSAMARGTSVASRAKASEDCRAGAKSPNQVEAAKPGKPCSATVGTSGSVGSRSAPATAMGRTRPSRISGKAGGRLVLPIGA